MIVQRVERHIIAGDVSIENLCFLSKNLYNISNFYLRRRFIASGRLLGANQLINIFTRLDQVDYRALPAQTSQQVIKLLEKNWKAFFKANKDYKKNPSRYLGKPNLPKYKEKSGKNIIIFTNQQLILKDNYVHFPKKANIVPLKTTVLNICQVRIIPQTTCFVVEVVYKKEVKNYGLDAKLFLSVDLGVNNFAACTNNTGLKPFIVDGRAIKSINQYYNKKKAKLMSFVGKRGTSNRILKLTHKRNNKIEDYLHKTSRFIINYCLENNIKNIVIGKNKNWKQNVNMKTESNQKFVAIPFARLIEKIQYKAEDVGINVILQEESYTSKCSALDLEPVKKHTKYVGRRVKRGLFRTSTKRKINADVNGSFNILRKVIGDAFLFDRGIVSMPNRIYIL